MRLSTRLDASTLRPLFDWGVVAAFACWQPVTSITWPAAVRANLERSLSPTVPRGANARAGAFSPARGSAVIVRQ